jgi:hypothetical protein
MIKYIKLLERLNYQNIFLINKLRQMVMRSAPGLKLNFFAKQKGRCEFSIHFASDLAIETLHGGREISKKRYENY